jgi:hypothetical protein
LSKRDAAQIELQDAKEQDAKENGSHRHHR